MRATDVVEGAYMDARRRGGVEGGQEVCGVCFQLLARDACFMLCAVVWRVLMMRHAVWCVVRVVYQVK